MCIFLFFQCAHFGDCCIDAKAYRQTDQVSSRAKFECTNFKQYGDLYVRNKCPETWQDPEVKTRCENPDVVADPMGSLPVTNVENGFTYSNFYCSLCNGDRGEKQVNKNFYKAQTKLY